MLDMFIILLVEIAYGPREYFGPPESFRDIFYTAYRNSGKIHLDQGFFHRRFPAAVAFDDGRLKRDTFELVDI